MCIRDRLKKGKAKDVEALNEFTREEVAKHNTIDDFYIIYKNLVFDLTNWINLHPGGSKILERYAGKDCTEDFKKQHAWVNPSRLIGDRQIGYLSSDEKK
eukprot:TRINITY_DN9703_c0_g1_i3.p1 TRINITY_DN9703_c0_g1~~TRINITY_DN9703_c0_g1_i3.p1  ORF type:complete len:100 (+),score=25.33 TRINITY_DN9703_c0_g1_i3:70-369(+)